MLKRLMNFLLFSTGITPKDHKEQDKYAAMRAKRAEWERLQQAREDAHGGAGGTGPNDWGVEIGEGTGSMDDHGDGGDGGGDGD